MFCAGTGSSPTSVCHGDSGGPAVLKEERFFGGHQVYTLVGVLSIMTKDCGDKDNIAGYSDIFHFLPWIEEIVLTGGSNRPPVPCFTVVVVLLMLQYRMLNT